MSQQIADLVTKITLVESLLQMAQPERKKRKWGLIFL